MNDLNQIKKYYGEKMMHLCRELFSTLLEKENLLFSLLEQNFAHSKFLYDDIIENNMHESFKNYIYSLVNLEKKEIDVIRTPRDLLSAAGYNFYECHTETDIQKFKKYYYYGEELCTFKGGRLDSCYVFFAVKKNINEIKREKFLTPERQDEYGTSVISIQFSKGECNTLSIKNRYNHIVNNPDATFSNNLENIIPGLTKAFEKEYNLNINQNNNNFELPNYVKANDGKYYKHNYEINNVYYCPDNIIIDNSEVIKDYIEKEKYLIIDYFIIDLINKEIKLYDANQSIKDSFLDYLQNIKKIDIKKQGEYKQIIITLENSNEVYLKIDKFNRIISYKNDFLTNIANEFLLANKYLEEISLLNVETIGDGFLRRNKQIKEINLPNVTIIGDDFVTSNRLIKKIDFPNLTKVGNNFLYLNSDLEEINLPKIINISNNFLYCNNKIKKIDFPNLTTILNNFFYLNSKLEEIKLPSVTTIGNKFLYNNEEVKELNLLSATIIGDNFLNNNKWLKKINSPNLTKIGNNFLYSNRKIEEINFPKITSIGDNFIHNNNKIKKIYLPIITIIGDNFLFFNHDLEEINFPYVTSIGNCFLNENDDLKKIDIPQVTTIGDNFLVYNNILKELVTPKLNIIGNNFLVNNQNIKNKNKSNEEEIQRKK